MDPHNSFNSYNDVYTNPNDFTNNNWFNDYVPDYNTITNHLVLPVVPLDPLDPLNPPDPLTYETYETYETYDTQQVLSDLNHVNTTMTQIYAKKINVNLEKVFDHNEILTKLELIEPLKLIEILMILEDKSDQIKFNVIVRYYKKTLLIKMFKSKRPENYPTKIDLLNTPKFITDSKWLYNIFCYFDFLINECIISEKLLLLEYLSDDTNKMNFIKNFKIFNDMSLQFQSMRSTNIEMLIRILSSITCPIICRNILNNYFQMHLCDFDILCDVINLFHDDINFNVFEHQECSKVLRDSINAFNICSVGLQIYLYSFDKKIRCKIFKLVADEHTKINLSNIVTITKLLNANELSDFFHHCIKLRIDSFPLKYANKTKIKGKYNKKYIKRYTKELNIKNDNFLVYEDELELVLHLNAIISNCNAKSISNLNYNNHLFKEDEIIQVIVNLLLLMSKILYQKDEQIMVDRFQIIQDILNSHIMDYPKLINSVLETLPISIEHCQRIYNSFKKLLNEKCNSPEIQENLFYSFFNNIIKKNCKTLHCNNMKKLMDIIDCSHYKTFLHVIYDRHISNEIEIMSPIEDHNCYQVQKITELLCANIKNNNTLLNSDHYEKIVVHLHNLFWEYLHMKKSSYLDQFETNLLSLLSLVTSNSKVNYAIIYLNSRDNTNSVHKNELIEFISANIKYIADITHNVNLKSIVTKNNIDLIFMKMSNMEQKLKTLDYLIQNEMEMGNECENYIFSKLCDFLIHFKDCELDFVKLISKYIDVSKKMYCIRANKGSFSSEEKYREIEQYVMKLKK